MGPTEPSVSGQAMLGEASFMTLELEGKGIVPPHAM
jgi:hypothetical protein